MGSTLSLQTLGTMHSVDLNKLRIRYCERLIAHLKSRFPDLGMRVALCSILDCHNYPADRANLSELDSAFETVVTAYDGMEGLGDNLPARAGLTVGKVSQ